jgi:hypothetical protein
MKIKKIQTTKRIPHSDLVRHWLEMTLPPIAGIILLPHVFLFLGYLYAEEFHSIPAQTLYFVVGIQGFMVIITPIVTAWITLKRVSYQLQTLAQSIANSAEKISQSRFINDNWVTLEKQQDDLGQAARQIKDAFLELSETNRDDKIARYLGDTQDEHETEYSSLFSLNIQENGQLY